MKKNILLVDDDQRLRELLKDYLNEKKLDVFVCDDFNNANQIIRFFIFSPIKIYLFYTLIIVVLLVSFACQLGDLFISFLKRKAKVKDTGDLLPGHGGVLDRIDGILLAIPIGIFLWKFLIEF